MTEKIYHFDVPVSGHETFSVIASSYEEAVKKINNGKYYIEPETSDIEWDFGNRDTDEVLPKCYTLQDIEENTHDNSN
ncbi:hypothetical protein [Acinetobacter bereziniae]|uniref:hypothetical protein n=1 Tax=Acinetobacter bereziniae TaxID=106648 RepID=UPI001901397D|nr:hypothetical protein [Acinetobacter bereziniae]MBJ8426007.1 hypothetical protein [Acinetobacter bereziniae]